MKRIILAFALGVTAYQVSFAQTEQAPKTATKDNYGYYGGFGQFNIGVLHTDYSALNSRLETMGYSGLDETELVTGGSGYGVIKKLIIGGEGYATRVQKSSANNVKVEAHTEGGMFQLGYVAYGKNHLLLYPLLGVGHRETSIEFLPQDGTTFNDVLMEPGRSSTLTYSNTILHASVNATYFIHSGATVNGGLLLGIKAGANFRPGTGEWSANEVAVSDAPDMNRSQFFVQASLGGGGLFKR
ncbi:MAG: hypothetical protein LPK19_17215 [Hymenobacteraceae bacterium]|nr:hypothetical protein [Hymenobacteraceae bacterium]MDX5397994.1 hypothetical protein [Hymenobacteraceae bacterium]MDX5514066.1 hypothetical protein [Hymenobacteraceae bacterium]